MADPIAQEMTDQEAMAKMDPAGVIPATELYDLMKSQEFRNLHARAGIIRQFFIEHGIQKAVVEYSGSGDSGNGSFATVTLADGTERDDVSALDDEFTVTGIPVRGSKWDDKNQVWKDTEETRDEPLTECLCSTADSFVDLRHGGYENNEGGEGTVTFTQTDITVNHSDFYIEVDKSVEHYSYPTDKVTE